MSSPFSFHPTCPTSSCVCACVSLGSFLRKYESVGGKPSFEARNEATGLTSSPALPFRSLWRLHLSRVSLMGHLKKAAWCFLPVIAWNHGLPRSPSVTSCMVHQVTLPLGCLPLPPDLTPHFLVSNCRPSDALWSRTSMLWHSLRLRFRFPRLTLVASLTQQPSLPLSGS